MDVDAERDEHAPQRVLHGLIAYAECASAPYAALRMAKSRTDAKTLRRWLDDPKLSSRKPLYVLLLGIAGDASDARTIEAQLDAAWRGALFEIGLPRGEVPLALLAFDVGVEQGQLAFIGVILAAAALVRKVGVFGGAAQRAVRLAPYFIGSLAAFWFVDRVAAFTAS